MVSEQSRSESVSFQTHTSGAIPLTGQTDFSADCMDCQSINRNRNRIDRVLFLPLPLFNVSTPLSLCKEEIMISISPLLQNQILLSLSSVSHFFCLIEQWQHESCSHTAAASRLKIILVIECMIFNELYIMHSYMIDAS